MDARKLVAWNLRRIRVEKKLPQEALAVGLVDRVAEPGTASTEAAAQQRWNLSAYADAPFLQPRASPAGDARERWRRLAVIERCA